MKIKIETNFSFKKLANKVEDIMDEYKAGVGGAYASGARTAINSRLSPELSDFTVKTRVNEGTTLPLKDTGALYKSLKGTKEGLQMLNYGLKHQTGISPNPVDSDWADIPARPFFSDGETPGTSKYVDKKMESQSKKNLIKNIKKGLQK